MKLDCLNTIDILLLIEKYSSELRVLDFQLMAVRSSIDELEDMLIKKENRSPFSKILEANCPDWIFMKSIERKSLPHFSLCTQVEESSKESKRSKLPVPDT